LVIILGSISKDSKNQPTMTTVQKAFGGEFGSTTNPNITMPKFKAEFMDSPE